MLSQEPLLPRNIPRLWILVLHVDEPSEQTFLWFWPRPNNFLPDIPRHYLGASKDQGPWLSGTNLHVATPEDKDFNIDVNHSMLISLGARKKS